MPVEVVAYMLSDHEYPTAMAAVSADPAVCPAAERIKVACITNLECRHCRMLGGILKGTGITYRMLAVREERCLVILFREKKWSGCPYVAVFSKGEQNFLAVKRPCGQSRERGYIF